MSVPRIDGFIVDMVNESIEEDSIITCDEDSNKYVTRIRIQHVTRIQIQLVMRIRIQHVMRIRLLHLKRIDLVQGRTTVKEDGGTEVGIILSRPKMHVC